MHGLVLLLLLLLLVLNEKLWLVWVRRSICGRPRPSTSAKEDATSPWLLASPSASPAVLPHAPPRPSLPRILQALPLSHLLPMLAMS